ncbi:MAG: hypothetical protein ACTSU2_12850, partial [Promethearchaeota archaeon]
IGHIDKKNNVIISEAYPITHTAKKGHILKVSYDDPDYVDASLIEEEAYTRDPPEFIVGWYHSHPGIKIMFSQDDVKNQLGYQINNPLAVGLVFNQVRLLRQIEVASRKGDPTKQLTNDPGFKIFRLKDPSKGIQASYEEVPYEFSDSKITPTFIEEAKKFAGDVARLLPPKGHIEHVKNLIAKGLNKVNELYLGTESYIKTLIKKGETNRIPHVIETQRSDIERIIKPIENDIALLKEIMYYVEYKERGETIHEFQEQFKLWDEKINEILTNFDNLREKYST